MTRCYDISFYFGHQTTRHEAVCDLDHARRGVLAASAWHRLRFPGDAALGATL